ncbi:MAG: hypothetical protein ABI286_02705 [Edaphobacter sp.]
MKDPRILDTMTIAEASAFVEQDQQTLLQRWAETFAVSLQDFHIGHILTYNDDRSLEVPPDTVNKEVETLILLLLQQGLGEEIIKRYQPPQDAFALSKTELQALPLRARLHIEYLEREVRELRITTSTQKDQIRKRNWARS